jgi:hypothetical protein
MTDSRWERWSDRIPIRAVGALRSGPQAVEMLPFFRIPAGSHDEWSRHQIAVPPASQKGPPRHLRTPELTPLHGRYDAAH